MRGALCFGVTRSTSPPLIRQHTSRTPSTAIPGLQVSRIDPEAATEEIYKPCDGDQGQEPGRGGTRSTGRRPVVPVHRQMAVLRQFSKVVQESRRHFVVMDMAPTGHTLLLLDATGSHHREIARQVGDTMGFVTPLMRLQDPAQTKVVLVTLAETTPVLEAQDLQNDLEGPEFTRGPGSSTTRSPPHTRRRRSCRPAPGTKSNRSERCTA